MTQSSKLLTVPQRENAGPKIERTFGGRCLIGRVLVFSRKMAVVLHAMWKSGTPFDPKLGVATP